MKKTLAILMAVFMMMTVMPIAFAAESKDASLDNALNGSGTSLTYVTSEEYPWEVKTEDGRTYAKSTNYGIDDSISYVQAVIKVEDTVILSYDYKVSSESGYDGGIVYSNDGMIKAYTGEIDWTTEMILLNGPGEFTFKWAYEKDESRSEGDDCFCVDNVRIQSQPAAAGFSVAGSMFVGLGAARSVEVEADPWYASLPTITATSANEAIATVSVDGTDIVITGKSLGQTVITVTVGSLGSKTIAVEVKESKYVRGYVLYDEYLDSGWYQFDLASGAYTLMKDDGRDIYAAEYYNGNVYAFDFDTKELISYDEDFESTTVIATLDRELFDMAYDYSSSTMYAISHAGSGTDLVTVDLETGEIDVVVSLSAAVVTLACDGNGTLYAIDLSRGSLNTIDKSTGNLAAFTTTGIAPNYVQSMAFDANDNLYWAACADDDAVCGIYALDTATEELSDKLFDVIEVTGLHFGIEVELSAPTSITVTPEAAEMCVGDELKLNVTAEPADANKKVTWSSSDESVATVSANGTVKAVRMGVATITATSIDGSCTDTCQIIVNKEKEWALYEDFNDALEGWQILDMDGDGYTWELIDESSGLGIYEGSGAIKSESFINGDIGALNANNWLVSPQFTAKENMTASWYAVAQDVEWCDNYRVYVAEAVEGAEVADYPMTQLYEGAAPQDWENFTAEIPAEYIGKNVVLIFVHEDTDNFALKLDLVEVYNIVEAEPVTEYTVTFVDGLTNEVIGTEKVAEGGNATLPTPPVHEGYTFTGWDHDGTNITADTTITAQYAPEVTYQLGDVNMDGKLNTGDAVAILRHAAEMQILTEEQLALADYNGDGVVNTGDAVKILRFCAGMETA